MKREIRYTLLSDGSSDRALIPILNWTLTENIEDDILIQSDWADLYYSSKKLDTLSEKINYALKNFPCDILFIHRDAEHSSTEVYKHRQEEISDGWDGSIRTDSDHMVPIIPVRMSEAWLLISESAIRKASSNPNGTVALQLPRIKDLEKLTDPKAELTMLIRTASDLNKRNLTKLNQRIRQAIHLTAENINDYSLLRGLNAFKDFEDNLKGVLNKMKL